MPARVKFEKERDKREGGESDGALRPAIIFICDGGVLGEVRCQGRSSGVTRDRGIVYQGPGSDMYIFWLIGEGKFGRRIKGGNRGNATNLAKG